MMKTHFFDVDHTLFPGATGLDYLLRGLRKGIFPLRPLLGLPRVVRRYRQGHLTLDLIFREEIPFLKGLKRSTLENLAEELFDRKIKKRLFPGVLSHMREVKARGEEIVLASSSVDIILDPLCHYLEIDQMICSRFLFREGFCTGVFDGKPAFGEEKKRLALAYLETRGRNPGDAFFYSDSIHDLPLLEAVGHPVGVNPDKMLKKIAQERGWRILSLK